MTSPNHEQRTKLGIEDWMPSNVYHPVPSLIIPCGNVANFDELKRDVNNRLNRYQNDGVIRWASAQELSIPPEKEKFAKYIIPMLDLGFWQTMFNYGYVEHIPDANCPMQLQILVICDLHGDKASKEVEEWLSGLAEVIKSIVSDGIIYSITLLMLGDSLIGIDKLSAYWPRFYIGSRAWGETQASLERIKQACQNIIVYLTTSEFTSFINRLVNERKKSVRWIALGASAILVDTQAIRSRLDPEVFKEFVEPLVRELPNDTQKDLLKDAAIKKSREYRGMLLREAARIVSFSGWKISTKDYDLINEEWAEPEVTKNKQMGEGCYLFPGTDLARILFGKDKDVLWWLDEKEEKPVVDHNLKLYKKISIRLNFWWNCQFLSLLRPISLPNFHSKEEQLAQNYQKLYTDLQRELEGPKDTGYQKLLDMFTFLLDRSIYTGDTPPLNSVTHWPTGLVAMSYTINAVIKTLKESPVFTYMGNSVMPAPLASEKYFRASTHDDISFIEGEIRRYRRFQRSLLSPLGVFLKLVVAWPLLVEFLDILTHWAQPKVVLVSSGILIILGLVDLIVWRVKDRQKLVEIRSLINDRLAKRVLSLLAKSLESCISKTEERLYSINRSVTEFIALLANEYQQVQLDCEHYTNEIEYKKEEDALFWLTDYVQALGTSKILVEGFYAEQWGPLKNEFARVWNDIHNGDGQDHMMLSWKSEARRRANADASQGSNGKYDKYESAFLSETFLASNASTLFSKGRSVRKIIGTLRQASHKYASETFRPGDLLVYALTDSNKSLQGGLKWKWLYQYAHPLGGVTTNYSLATAIVVSDNAPLGMGTGRTNEYWPKDAQVVTSCALNEIGCVRAVIEWV